MVLSCLSQKYRSRTGYLGERKACVLCFTSVEWSFHIDELKGKRERANICLNTRLLLFLPLFIRFFLNKRSMFSGPFPETENGSFCCCCCLFLLTTFNKFSGKVDPWSLFHCYAESYLILAILRHLNYHKKAEANGFLNPINLKRYLKVIQFLDVKCHNLCTTIYYAIIGNQKKNLYLSPLPMKYL